MIEQAEAQIAKPAATAPERPLFTMDLMKPLNGSDKDTSALPKSSDNTSSLGAANGPIREHNVVPNGSDKASNTGISKDNNGGVIDFNAYPLPGGGDKTLPQKEDPSRQRGNHTLPGEIGKDLPVNHEPNGRLHGHGHGDGNGNGGEQEPDPILKDFPSSPNRTPILPFDPKHPERL